MLSYKLSNSRGQEKNKLQPELVEAQLELRRVRHIEILLESMPQLVIQFNIIFPCLLKYLDTTSNVGLVTFFKFFEKDLGTIAAIATSALSLFATTSNRMITNHHFSISSSGLKLLFSSTVFYGSSLLLLQAVAVHHWSFHRLVLYVYLFSFSSYLLLIFFESFRNFFQSKCPFRLSPRETRSVGRNYSSLVNFDSVKEDKIYRRMIHCCKSNKPKKLFCKINKNILFFYFRFSFYCSIFVWILHTIFVQVGCQTSFKIGSFAFALFAISFFLKIFYFKCFHIWSEVDATIKQGKEDGNILRNEI